MKVATDALIHPIQVGDRVAYVSRHGSSISITERRIEDMVHEDRGHHHGKQFFVRLSPFGGQVTRPRCNVLTHNLVKL